MSIPKGAPRVAFFLYLLIAAGCLRWLTFLVGKDEAASIFAPFAIAVVNFCIIFARSGGDNLFAAWTKVKPWVGSAFFLVHGYLTWVVAAQTMVRFSEDSLEVTSVMALGGIPLLATAILFTFSDLPVWRTMFRGEPYHTHLRSDRKDTPLRTDHEY